MSLESSRTEGEEAAAALLAAIEKFKNRLSLRIVSIASAIETDSGGIVSTPDNIARVGELIARMKGEFLDDEFVDAVADYIASMDTVTADVIDAFDEFTGVREDVLQAISRSYKAETAETLTNPNTYSVWGNVANSLIFGVATGAAIEDTVDAVGRAVEATEIAEETAGVVESAPLMLQRQATAAAAEQVGAEFFFFQGRPIKTTRKWCREREGHYWHIEEIREWGRKAASGAEVWDGMVDGTDEQSIFTYLGGWYGDRNSCRHILVPVLRFAVAKEDLERMRNKGLID